MEKTRFLEGNKPTYRVIKQWPEWVHGRLEMKGAVLMTTKNASEAFEALELASTAGKYYERFTIDRV
jgi:hypothetical protein